MTTLRNVDQILNTAGEDVLSGANSETGSVIFAASHVYVSNKYYNNSKMSPWTLRLHRGNCFNTNGTFTAPKAGIYRFDYHNNHSDNVSNSNQYIDWFKNGSSLGWGRIYGHYTSGWENISGHLIIELNQNDYIELYGYESIRADGGTYGLWSGYLLAV